MLADIYISIQERSTVAPIVIAVAVMLSSGFAMTRLTKLLHLPNVTAYIVAGILIGPYCLGLVPENVVGGTEFLPDIALAFIAFGTGEFFKISVLKQNGFKVLIITVLEACIASIFVFAAVYCVLGVELSFSVVLAALASATAPASTLMTIRQTGAKGDFVNTLLQVVALDDVVGLVAYSVAISIAVASVSGGGLDLGLVIRPVLVNIAVLALGCAFGFLLKLLMPKKRTTDNRLIISIALLFAFCGICAAVDVSPLLGCMSMAAVYINISGDDKLFKQLNYFSPPLLLLFFVRSGVCFELGVLTDTSEAVGGVPLLLIGVVYFVVRIVGKYAGAFVGCVLTNKPATTRNYFGFALIPQAGVAIGLAALGARTLGGAGGDALQTVILASSVLYELIGPACAKFALYRSGSYSDRLEALAPVPECDEQGQQRSPVDVLIERIRKIQSELPAHDERKNEEEEAFLEAAEEQYAAMRYERNRRHGSIR